MSFDYEALRAENERRYGTDIKRVGDLLLGKRYADRTHFIFELLQNAEDAVARRPAGWTGSRSIGFELSNSELRVSHFGDPFNERDVRGICAIGRGTKDLTDIGEFGIGFKSVYAVTDRPRVYSGVHAFAVEDYVLPVELPPVDRDPEETLFVLPFKPDDPKVYQDILQGLHRLSSNALLFLREIQEIRWNVEEGASEAYVRECKDIGEGVRRVTVVEEESLAKVDDTWLVFSRPVDTDEGKRVGFAEIAFRTLETESLDDEMLQPVEQPPLIVYFPTVIETHLGFLLQGPYRTTPSRDNVPTADSWNNWLVEETGELLVDALRWLRDHDCLDAAALHCLPLDRSKLSEAREGMFLPLFDAARQALSSEPLLPRQGGGHVPAGEALVARTEELRDLLSPRQLEALFGDGERRWWVTADITRDRTPELYRYVREELEVAEITPETLVSRLKSRSFLEGQPDSWIRDLYRFLAGQRRLRRRFDALPLVRLEDGSHVLPQLSGQPQAFLPGRIDTDFPTVRRAVCDSEAAREFLRSLGLSEPDPVDDVLRNVLPKYKAEQADILDEEYQEDIRRIVEAYGTDSEARRKRLVSALEETPFVRAVDAGAEEGRISRPGEIYIATERLKQLFDGVRGVLLADDSHAVLRGEKPRKLLEAAGAVRYIRPVERTGLGRLSREERKRLRDERGHSKTSGRNDHVDDWEIDGLKELFELLPHLNVEERRTRAELLWNALAQLEDRRGKGVFEGVYSWTHYGSYKNEFDARFVQRLNTTPWVPDDAGDLQTPDLILFDDTGWEEHPFLQSKIRFRAPVLDELAEEAGIDPGVLDLLKEYGVTSEADFRERLRFRNEQMGQDEESKQEADQPAKTRGTTERPSSPAPPKPTGSRGAGGQQADEPEASIGADVGVEEPATGGRGQPPSPPQPDTGAEEAGAGAGEGVERPPRDSANRRRFISYVAVHPDEHESDPDGLEREERMKLEEEALTLILSREPDWHRTPPGNPGFDLYKPGLDGEPVRWCEVKAMTGSLDDRPVAMSRRQFKHANREGEYYWLYVVEYAGTEHARIVRIQNPAGKAQYLTFDRGWRAAAEGGWEDQHKA